MKEKELIWEDCPACALKHLSAAYAALTMPDGRDTLLFAASSEILVARSIIANHECEAGYLGNRDLAAGCLALAESLPNELPCDRRDWRGARLALAKGAVDAEDTLVRPSFSAFAAAHIVEALRELPELLDRVHVRTFFTANGNFNPVQTSGVRDWLRESILWVKTQYELETK